MSIEKPDESTNSDPTELPPWWRSGLNYIEAVARYVASGCRNVPEEADLLRMPPLSWRKVPDLRL
jgi:hypothetical protein